jgi:hypothetical protein
LLLQEKLKPATSKLITNNQSILHPQKRITQTNGSASNVEQPIAIEKPVQNSIAVESDNDDDLIEFLLKNNK